MDGGAWRATGHTSQTGLKRLSTAHSWWALREEKTNNLSVGELAKFTRMSALQDSHIDPFTLLVLFGWLYFCSF